MSSTITPTPGRIVWFYPAEFDGIGRLGKEPLAAIVAGAHNDHQVNLAVFDAYGGMQQRTNVHLVQPDEDRPNGAHATWMPYQLGQMAKTEQVEAQLAASVADAADAEGEPPAAPVESKRKAK